MKRLLWWMNHEASGAIMMVTASEDSWALSGGENNRWLHFPLRIEEPFPMSMVLNIVISRADNVVECSFLRVKLELGFL